MSNVIVNHDPLEINGQHSTNQDQVMVLLAKLQVLLELGLNSEPEMQTRKSLHSYLCMLSDLVEQLAITLGLG
jgi:hypothetical protein